MYENIAPPSNPQLIKRDANGGCPYTLRFQNCDAIRQNSVRACDWNNDNQPDLIAGDTDGYVWYFRNTTNRLYPVFAAGEKLQVKTGPQTHVPLSVMDGHGHARLSICNWDNDADGKDLLIADSDGYLSLFRNIGTDAEPDFEPGQRLSTSDGRLIQRGSRSSCLVCDWNNDGKNDVIFAGDVNDEMPYVCFENTGTLSNPILAPFWSLGLADYTRPNLGSFVDWDGDGKRDFIACQFEQDVRLYINTGTNSNPSFSNTDGVIIVQPYCTTQLISGADAFDWRGDRDFDILTGQGHGGSGLRFYERDYIESWLHNNAPTVTVQPADITPPGRVEQFQATPQEGQTRLSWLNPQDADFTGTMIRYRTDTFPTDPVDGILLIDQMGSPGSSDSFLQDNVLVGQDYFYSAFAHDGSLNFAVAAHASRVRGIPGDFDHDQDVDQTDFGHLQACMAGPSSYPPPGCEDAELTGDLTVDDEDLAVLLACFSGPGVVSLCMAG
jgi:hypothetical protein